MNRSPGARASAPPHAMVEETRRNGTLVVGGPERVRAELVEQTTRCGIEYLVLQLAFGSLGHANEMRSLELFAEEVMPALQRA